jgi:hypothetical protein
MVRSAATPRVSNHEAVASSFETHRFAMLLRMRSSAVMVRRAATPRVSNHEAAGLHQTALDREAHEFGGRAQAELLPDDGRRVGNRLVG